MSKLDGTWYNELGSTMTIATDDNGGITGKYNSAVGKAEDYYILTGRYDVDPTSGEGTSVGWVVNWRNAKLNAHSTATWSGQYFGGSDETILTHWLLTRSSTPDAVWNSTNIGTDTFTRKKPSAAEIAKAEALSFHSPHPEKIIAALNH